MNSTRIRTSAAAVSVHVTDVKVKADSTAEVTFDVLSGGATMLTGETGTAVLEDGAWKVSESSSPGLLAAMGGSSGVLLAILFAASAAASTEGRYWTVALLEGLNKLKEYGGAKLGDRTMVDALEPALRALSQGKTLAFATDLARQGADATAHIKKAAAGRASYVPTDNLNGVIDPGAEAVAILFDALNQLNQKGLQASR